MSTPCRFDDKEYINWVKCSLALIHFKEGLHDYIDTEVNNLHADIHHTISTIVGPSVQNQCCSCTWRDIKQKKGAWTIKCQNKICDRWLSEILANHTNPQNRNINWKNADITRWPMDAYEVAKVYMPKGQDQTKNLPQDFDAPAILSLLKYCVWFSQKIPNTSILSDLIDIRNEVMHSGDLRVTGFKKDSCVDKMVQLLSDLNIHGDVLTELQKAKREDIDINFRETEVRALRSLVSSLKGSMDSLHDVQHQFTDVLDTVQTTLSSVQAAQTQQGQEIQEIKDNTMETRGKVVTMETDIQGIKSEVEQLTEMYQKIQSFLTNNPDIGDKNISENIQELEETVSRLRSKQEKIEKEINYMGREIKGIKRKFVEIEEKIEMKHPTVPEEMKCLRNELLYKYKSFRTIPFSPIDEKEEEVPLEYIYTEVVIKCEDKENAYANRKSDRERRMKKEEQLENKLTSYKQIFGGRRRIILTGLSGSGKSTFCKKIVNAWCRLQENKNDSSHVTEPSTYDASHITRPSTYDTSDVAGPSTHVSSNVIVEENVLLKFDLLFYINSPAISNETKLTDVLYNQCIKKEEEREKNEIQNKLSKLLNDQPEKVLIIFDGLDEMGHTPYFLVDVFKRDLYPGISVLMGMRPWKISRLGLKPLSHFDLLLDIQGFSTDNALEFVKKVIDMNGSMYGETKEKYLSRKDRDVLTSFKNIPLLLLFLAHIWYREQSLTDKYKDLYNQIIDFLIRRWVKKAENKCTDTMSDEESMDLHLKMFWETHLSSVCKAAYHFLLEGKNGPSVVIPQQKLIRELGENSEVKLTFLLGSGIMSKVDFFSPLEKNVSVMFLHMSIQEYLASIYLVKDEDAFQKFLKSLGTINDVLRYENIFIFISGLDASQGHKAFTRICELCDEDTMVIQFREKEDNYQVIQNLNDMYKKCVNEMNEQKPIEIADIIITSETDYKFRSCFVKSLFMRGIWYDGVLGMTNLTSLRLCNITMSKKYCRSLRNTHLKILVLQLMELHDDILDLSALTNLTSFRMSNVQMSAECSRSLCSSISGCAHLEKLNLESVTLHDGVLDMSAVTNLTTFKMSCVTMSAGCSISLCSSISGCAHLEKLNLKSVKLRDGVLDMSTLTNLTSFKMSNVTMSAECSRSLCSSISGCAHLKKLILTDLTLLDGELDMSTLTNLAFLYEFCVTMTEGCRRCMCSSISGCTLLKTLYLEYSTLHGELDLSTLTNLTYLNLYHVIMSEECSRSFCSSISGCTNLDKLVLNCIKLHDGVLDLSSLTSLTFLYLSNVMMSEECGRSLCNSISGCTHLESLTLIEIITLHDGVLDLKNLKNLRHVKIWATMSSECTRILDQSLEHCHKLEFCYTPNRLGGDIE